MSSKNINMSTNVSSKTKAEEEKRYEIIKLPPWMAEVSVGDRCIICGGAKVLSEKEGFGKEYVGKYLTQYHSTYLINDIMKNRENYWIEFLPKDCVRLLDKDDIIK